MVGGEIDIEKARAGRQIMALRCITVAKWYTPVGLTIEYRKGLSGRAWPRENRVSVPRPITRKSLYIYLHEMAHIVLNHRGQRKRHVEEMQAEKWAHTKMREAGLSVPRSMTRRGKAYVGWKIEQARKRGAKHIDREAAAYARMSREET